MFQGTRARFITAFAELLDTKSFHGVCIDYLDPLDAWEEFRALQVMGVTDGEHMCADHGTISHCVQRFAAHLGREPLAGLVLQVIEGDGSISLGASHAHIYESNLAFMSKDEKKYRIAEVKNAIR